MAEKAIKWIEVGFKLAVIVGPMAVAYLSQNFVSKAEFMSLREEMRVSLTEIKGSIKENFTISGHIQGSISTMDNYVRSIEQRTRNLESR